MPLKRLGVRQNTLLQGPCARARLLAHVVLSTIHCAVRRAHGGLIHSFFDLTPTLARCPHSLLDELLGTLSLTLTLREPLATLAALV